MKTYVLVTTAVFLILVGVANAQTERRIDNDSGRFTKYKSNYVILRNDSVSDDSSHIEFQFSTKYLFSDRALSIDGLAFYLAYTGKFDFFLNSRDSSPVINRLNNPEALLRMTDAPLTRGGYYQLALGHESNGQAINSQASYDTFAEPFKQDFVSRGWDYLSFEGDWHIGGASTELACKENFRCIKLTTTVRHFLDDGIFQKNIEDKIYKAPDVDEGIEKYDGLRIAATFEGNLKTYSKRFGNAGVSLGYRTGSEKPTTHNTWTIEALLSVKIFNSMVPLYLRYHNGFVEEISDYSNKTNYVSLGMLF